MVKGNIYMTVAAMYTTLLLRSALQHYQETIEDVGEEISSAGPKNGGDNVGRMEGNEVSS